jgi:hypothetical protein
VGVVLAPVLAAIGVLPAEPLEVYRAWLDSAGHTAFTGAQAEVQAQVGGRFTAWDGYIEGRTLQMEAPGAPAGGAGR